MELAAVVRHGSRDIPVVTLTFDDGPGAGLLGLGVGRARALQ
jgi:peptidoglycan/xylan/chitin deacetylase (PgdA/CDA1 family)